MQMRKIHLKNFCLAPTDPRVQSKRQEFQMDFSRSSIVLEMSAIEEESDDSKCTTNKKKAHLVLT